MWLMHFAHCSSEIRVGDLSHAQALLMIAFVHNALCGFPIVCAVQQHAINSFFEFRLYDACANVPFSRRRLRAIDSDIERMPAELLA